MTVVCRYPSWNQTADRGKTESAGLSDEEHLSGLRRLAFIASWGGAFIRRVYGHPEVLRGNGLLTQIPAKLSRGILSSHPSLPKGAGERFSED